MTTVTFTTATESKMAAVKFFNSKGIYDVKYFNTDRQAKNYIKKYGCIEASMPAEFWNAFINTVAQ